MLFDRFSILDVLPHQERQIKEKIASLASNVILNASEEDLVASIKDEYTLDMPELDESDIHIDYGEEKIDVSQDPMRPFIDRSRPFYIAGTRVTFIVPFSGDPALFDIQPQGFSFSLGGSHAKVVGSELHMTFAGPNINGERAKTEFENELRQIKQNLANLRNSIDRHNSGLEQQVRSQIQQRRTKLLADASLAAAIGYPIKRRDGAPTTYAVPVQRRKPKIERPAVTTAPFKPEPVLAMTEYEDILNIIRNMVRVMEQSPKAFEKIGEEDLRTHFLVQLNGQYEGNATGETFNFQGKTDILIKVDGKNVFIAECKFWAGEKQFSDTIDQLLSYLSWRDTKTAVLIFNRNVNFSEVLGKIEEATPNHKNYKRNVGKLDESSFRYIFHQPKDKNRELTLTVLAFDIPTVSKKENEG
jgi:hypothetical protein